ncbi:MAG: Rossmann-like and DUF2520 domain-containing protein [Balneolaceae bacterium]
MNRSPSLTVIGAGSVGSILLRQAHQSGYSIHSVVLRTEHSFCPEPFRHQAVPFSDLTADELGDWIFVTTPDDRIESVASRMASQPDVDWTLKSVVHLSGVCGADLLHELENQGARTASCHPLQTFVRERPTSGFETIHVTLEGEQSLLSELRHFWRRLGAHPHVVTREQKSRVHLSAVFLSNYLVALASIAEDLLQDVIPDGDLQILEPLLYQTVSNLLSNGPAQSLTGPIERGDTETIRLHLEQMAGSSDRQEIYRHLGLVASGLAARNGQNPDVTEAVQDLLVGKKKP